MAELGLLTAATKATLQTQIVHISELRYVPIQSYTPAIPHNACKHPNNICCISGCKYAQCLLRQPQPVAIIATTKAVYEHLGEGASLFNKHTLAIAMMQE
jgi:hypothetical protein